MSEKKRRWFQIHLSTAIVLMFVAGGLIYRNLCPYDVGGFKEIIGWPFPLMFHRYGEYLPVGYYELTHIPWFQRVSGFWYNVSLNILVCVTCMLAIASLLESLIWRREARIP